LKHIEGAEKDGKANGDTYEKMGEIEANIEERILEFIESAPEHNGNPEEVLEWHGDSFEEM